MEEWKGWVGLWLVKFFYFFVCAFLLGFNCCNVSGVEVV